MGKEELMSKEKQIQNELERYWGQMDRIEQAIIKNKNRIGAVGGELDKVERMLKWIIRFNHVNQPEFIAYKKKQLPDISDILEEK